MSKSILIVDDSRVAREVIKEFLSSDTIKISEAANGKEALNYLQQNYVDLIICDLNMPQMNGLELIENIKSSDKLNSIPIALITSESSFDSLDKAKKMGVIAFLVKPVTEDQISTLVGII